MEILFDYQIFHIQRFGGISRYFYELINQFSNDPDTVVQLPIKYSKNYYLNSSGISKGIREVDMVSPFKMKIQRSINRSFSNKNLTKVNYDLFHPTYYDSYFLKKLRNKPFILTVFDLIHEKYMPESEFIINQKKKLIESADKIIAISESTKRDTIDIYKIPPEKIAVVYLGNSLNLENNGYENPFKNDGDYLLYVGSRSGYKNFGRFFLAVSRLMDKYSNLKLVCAGGGKFNFGEMELIRAKRLEDRINQIDVTDQQLAILYDDALSFVFPSEYEGFGIPVLEAFACGCPTIISNSSSLPEVAGDAVSYFDPTKSESIEQAIENVICNRNLQKVMREKGYKRLEQFSWSKAAKETKKIYGELL